MAKENKTVRMARETKSWLEELILHEQVNLSEKVRQGLLSDLEDNLASTFSEELKGISFTIGLNITAGSMIEKAYYATKNSDWESIIQSLQQEEKNVQVIGKGATPRVSLDVDVLRGLESYQLTFQSLKNYFDAKRSVNLSYVIKVVLYAYREKLNKNSH